MPQAGMGRAVGAETFQISRGNFPSCTPGYRLKTRTQAMIASFSGLLNL